MAVGAAPGNLLQCEPLGDDKVQWAPVPPSSVPVAGEVVGTLGATQVDRLLNRRSRTPGRPPTACSGSSRTRGPPSCSTATWAAPAPSPLTALRGQAPRTWPHDARRGADLRRRHVEAAGAAPPAITGDVALASRPGGDGYDVLTATVSGLLGREIVAPSRACPTARSRGTSSGPTKWVLEVPAAAGVARPGRHGALQDRGRGRDPLTAPPPGATAGEGAPALRVTAARG